MSIFHANSVKCLKDSVFVRSAWRLLNAASSLLREEQILAMETLFQNARSKDKHSTEANDLHKLRFC